MNGACKELAYSPVLNMVNESILTMITIGVIAFVFPILLMRSLQQAAILFGSSVGTFKMSVNPEGFSVKPWTPCSEYIHHFIIVISQKDQEGISLAKKGKRKTFRQKEGNQRGDWLLEGQIYSNFTQEHALKLILMGYNRIVEMTDL